MIVLAAFVPVGRTQDKTTFPTDDEIELLLTQADRAVQQYKPLVNEEELQLGKRGAEAAAKDRQVIQAVETAVEADDGIDESQLGLKLLDCSHLKNSKRKNLESRAKICRALTALLYGRVWKYLPIPSPELAQARPSSYRILRPGGQYPLPDKCV